MEETQGQEQGQGPGQGPGIDIGASQGQGTGQTTDEGQRIVFIENGYIMYFFRLLVCESESNSLSKRASLQFSDLTCSLLCLLLHWKLWKILLRCLRKEVDYLVREYTGNEMERSVKFNMFQFVESTQLVFQFGIKICQGNEECAPKVTVIEYHLNFLLFLFVWMLSATPELSKSKYPPKCALQLFILSVGFHNENNLIAGMWPW